MEIEKSKVSIQFLPIFRRSGDVLFFLYTRRFRGYSATLPLFCERTFPWLIFFSAFDTLCSSMTVPHRNHKCQEFTRWSMASIISNHKWRFMLGDESWWIHQVYYVKWRSTYEQNLRNFLFSLEFFCSFRSEWWVWRSVNLRVLVCKPVMESKVLKWGSF